MMCPPGTGESGELAFDKDVTHRVALEGPALDNGVYSFTLRCEVGHWPVRSRWKLYSIALENQRLELCGVFLNYDKDMVLTRLIMSTHQFTACTVTFPIQKCWAS